MSEKIPRRATYKGFLNGKEQDYDLKKWSAAKLIFNVARFGDLIRETTKDMGNDQTLATFLGNLVISIGSYGEVLMEMVAKDVINPRLTTQEVGELDPEDFIGIVEAIFKLNLTEALKKKFQGLLKNALPINLEEVSAEKVEETAEAGAKNGATRTEKKSKKELAQEST